ncbi:MAG: DUF951 domain-containing protein [Clostridia bacterium]|nr:DUF951 domain-containing protein [Clostridia bacterium]MDE7215270.1 DUF951 domain-containing protein [Clostridia bacterium]
MKLSELKVGDILVTKKNHPCGSNRWVVLRTGADFKLKCENCSHTVVMSSESVKKSVKAVIAE